MTSERLRLIVIITLLISISLPAIFGLQFVHALTDASSTDPITEQDANFGLVEAPATEATTTVPGLRAANSVPSSNVARKARIAGTKYVDYCTNGQELVALPGDPEIDANLNKPDAPTPKCPEGMTWDHTSGMDEYDTETGELEIGAYAKQADGSYIVHLAAETYVDATSTSEWPDRYVVLNDDPAGTAATASEASGGAASTTTQSTDTATTSTEELAQAQVI